MNKSFSVSPVLVFLMTWVFAIFSIIPNIKAQTFSPELSQVQEDNLAHWSFAQNPVASNAIAFNDIKVDDKYPGEIPTFESTTGYENSFVDINPHAHKFFTPDPGGIEDHIVAWLKPGVGMTATKWEDQSKDSSGNDNDNDFIPFSTLTPPKLVSDAINGYDVYDVGESNDDRPLVQEDDQNSLLPDKHNYSVVMVLLQRDDLVNQQVFGSTQLSSGKVSSRYFRSDASGLVLNQGSSLPSEVFKSTINYRKNAFRILSFTYGRGIGTSVTDNYLRQNGVELASSQGQFNFNAARILLGDHHGVSGKMNGLLAEVILYDDAVSEAEMQKIESYLALKYGLELGSGVNYINSDGDAFFDTSKVGSYVHSPFGVGRDDTSGLNQEESTSHEPHANVKITTTRPANDKAFFMLSTNTASAPSIQTSELPVGIIETQRINKEWKVTKVDFTGSVDLTFDFDDNASFPINSNTVLYVDTDGDGNFTTGGPTRVTAKRANPSTQTVYFEGLQLNDGDVLTISFDTMSPGGVAYGLQAWLSAENGNNNLGLWSDYSPEGYDLTQTDPTLQGELINEGINFIPTYRFDGNHKYYSNTGAIDARTVYIVSDISKNTDDFSPVFGSSTSTLSGNRLIRVDDAGDRNKWRVAGHDADANDFTETSGDFNLNGQSTNNNHNFKPNILKVVSPAAIDFTSGIGVPGRTNSLSNLLTGDVSEVIVYDREVTGSDDDHVSSYLSIKYGIPLDQTVPRDIVSVSAGTVYDVITNAGFTHGIFGIGHDSHQRLDMTKSTNALTGYLTLETKSLSLKDGTFVLVGNNGLPDYNTINNLPPNYTQSCPAILNRVWKAQVTGTLSGVDMTFDLDSLKIEYAGKRKQDFLFVIDSDGDFSNAKTMLASELKGGKLRFEDIDFLKNGKYFTLMFETAAPGGVNSNLRLWLNAGTISSPDNTPVSTWLNRGSTNNPVQSVDANKPTYIKDEINHQPIVRFDGNDFLNIKDGVLNTSTQTEFYAFIVQRSRPSNTATTDILFSEKTSLTNDEGVRIYTPQQNGDLVFEAGGEAVPNTNADLRVTTNVGTRVGKPYLWGFGAGSVRSDQQFIDLNGVELARIPNQSRLTGINEAAILGGNATLGFAKTDIAEMAIYQGPITEREELRLQSYFALKYGITLDQTTPKNYVNSSYTTIWDAVTDPTYNHNIFGIGRDDCSNLNLLISSSVEEKGAVTLEHTSSFATNNRFVVVGNNGARGTNNTNLPTNQGCLVILDRIWYANVRASNNIVTSGSIEVDVTFNLDSLDIPIDATNFRMISYSSVDFPRALATSGATSASAYIENGTLNGRNFTVNKHEFYKDTSRDENYFTLIFDVMRPGAVVNDLQAWLAADNPNNSAGSWKDYSGNDYDLTQATSANQPELITDGFNFKPTYRFDGTNKWLENSKTVDARTVYIVSKVSKNTQINSTVFGRSGTGSYNQLVGVGDTDLGIWKVPPGASAGDFVQTTGTYELNGQSTSDRHNFKGNILKVVSPATTTFPSGIGVQARISSSASFFAGDVSEVIFYDRELTDDENHRISSYLSMKYGIPLDQTVPKDIVTSKNVVVYDIDRYADFHHGVFGLAREDCQNLVSNEATNALTGHMILKSSNNNLPNNTFVLVGENGLDGFNSNNLIAGELDSPAVLDRIWSVQVNGTPGTVDITFNLDSLGIEYKGRIGGSDFILLKNQSIYFTGILSTDLTRAIKGASLTQDGLLTFPNVDLKDREFFTLMFNQKAPGGALNNLRLWLNAESITAADNAAVGLWNGAAGHQAIQTTPSSQPTYQENEINFKPIVRFDGTDDVLNIEGGTLKANTENGYYIFLVSKTNTNGKVAVQYREDTKTNNNDGPIEVKLPSGTDEVGSQVSVDQNTGSGSAISVNWGTQVGKVHLWGFGAGTKASIDKQFINRDGIELISTQATFDITGDQSKTATIGAGNGQDFVDVDIAELVLYHGQVEEDEVNRIQSYLAIKYGITLDQTTPTDYTDSKGNTIWNAKSNTTKNYSKNIFGIGRDDIENLNSRQSASLNDNGAVTFTKNSAFTNDGTYLISGDNELTGINGANIPQDGCFLILNRIWHIQQTGNAGKVDVSFDLDKLEFSGGETDFLLVKNTTADFTTLKVTDPKVIGGATLVGTVLTFKDVEFGTDKFYSLIKITKSPGGVSNNLITWLNADIKASANSWEDQSLSGNDFEQNNASNQPELVNSAINGNPALKFVKTEADYMTSTMSGIMADDNNYTKFVVYQQFTEPGDQNLFGSAIAAGHSISLKSNTDPIVVHGSQNLLTSADAPAVNTPHLVRVRYGAGTGNLLDNTLTIEGKTVDRNSNPESYTDTGALHIGNFGTGNTDTFDGYIAEVILYDEALTNAEIQQIESYLAIKYGITLDQSTPRNYVNSKGVPVWTAATNTGYDKKIIGIGRDECTNLDQITSQSVDDTVSPGIRIKKETAFVNGDNGAYLLLGDNGLKGRAATNYPATLGGGLKTIWKVQETGETGNLEITIDLKNTVYSGTTNATDLYLIQDSNSDFVTGATTTVASSITNDKVTFTNINLKNGDYIGLGEKLRYYIAITYVSDGEENNSSTTIPVIYKVALTNNQGTKINAPADVTFNLEVDANNSTAVGGTDFTSTNLTVGFVRGVQEVEFRLGVLEDTDLEGPETVTLKLSDTQPAGYLKHTVKNSATGFIRDDDRVIDLRIQRETYGNEAGPSGPLPLVYKATLFDVTNQTGFKNESNRNIVVNFMYDPSTRAIGGTAGSMNVDFENSLVKTAIVHGDSTVLINIPVFDDNVAEGPEPVVLKLTDRSTGGIGISANPNKASAKNVIIDDDVKLELRIEKVSDGNEFGAIPAKYNVTLYEVTNPLNPRTFVNNGGPITVNYSFSGHAKGALAPNSNPNIGDTDYDNSVTSVVIPRGEHTAEISVQVFDDNAKEGPEDIIVTITDNDSGVPRAAIATYSSARADILDDDVNLEVKIISSTQGAEGGTTTPVTFVAALYESGTTNEFKNNGGTISVKVDLGGTASGQLFPEPTNPGDRGTSDYNNRIKTLWIANNASKGIMYLPVFEDRAEEGPESVIATLKSASGGIALGTPATGIPTSTVIKTSNIADDDLNLEVRIEKIDDGAEDETGIPTPATFKVTLYDVSDTSNPVEYTNNAGDITVTYSFTAGTQGSASGAQTGEGATGTSGNNDYDNTKSTITIKTGENSETISVPVFEDDALEGPEDIVVTLTVVDSGIGIPTDAINKTAAANIIDDDQILDVIITDSSDGAEDETSGTTTPVTFEVTLVKDGTEDPFVNRGGDITVMVDLDGTATGASAAAVPITGGSNDYNNTTRIVKIGKGESTGTLSLPVFEDRAVEGPESVKATLKGADSGVGLGDQTLITRTSNIQDDDSALEVHIERTRDGSEAGEVQATFTVMLYDVSDPNDPLKEYFNPGGDITVTYSFSGNASGALVGEGSTGTAGTNDYNNDKKTVKITNGNSKATIIVPVFDDAAVEGPEDIIVTLTTVDSGIGIPTDTKKKSASANITDDEIALELIISKSTEGEENDGGSTRPVEFEVTLVEKGTTTPFANTGRDIPIMVGLTGNATGAPAANVNLATGNTDYNNSDTTLTIAKGSEKGTLSLEVFEDIAVEGPESVIATLNNPSIGGVALGSATDITKTANIIDNELPLEVHITHVRDGIEAGNVSANYRVTLYNMTDPNNPVVYRNPGGPIAITYSFDGNATGAMAAEPTNPGNGGINDYDNTNKTVSIANGSSNAIISVPVFEDTAIEGPEDILVTITATDAGVGIPTDMKKNTARADIIDNDQPLDVIITASTNGAENGASGTTTPVTYTVTLVEDGTTTPFANNGGDLTVNLNLTGSATGATAAEPTTPGNVGNNDYDNANVVVTIDHGKETGVLTLPVFEDTKAEGPESIIAKLTGATGGVGLGETAKITKTATILDDDLKLEVRIKPTREGIEVGEVGARYTVTLYDVSDQSNPIPHTNQGGDITVNYGFSGTANGAATGEGALGTGGLNDFDNSDTEVTIASGSMSSLITVPVFDDAAAEGPESITLTITSVSSGIDIPTVQANKEATTNIIDNERILDVIITASTNGAEDSSGTTRAVTYTVTLVEDNTTNPFNNTGGDITVPVQFTGTATGAAAPNSDLTVGDTDYDNTKAEVKIPNGSNTAILTLPVFEDSANEGPESIIATLRTPNSGVILGDASMITRTANIEDDESTVEARIVKTTDGAENNNGVATNPTFTVTLYDIRDPNNPTVYTNTAGDININYAFTGNAKGAAVAEAAPATSGTNDFNNTTTMLTIASGQSSGTITVLVFEDISKEGPEDVIVTITAIDSGVGVPTVLANKQADAYIADDDQKLEVVITKATDGIEDQTGGTTTPVKFEVSLYEEGTTTPFTNGGGDITVMVSLTGNAMGAAQPNTATPGLTDYDNSTTEITIANGESTGELSLAVFEDSAKEGPESVIATLTNVNNGVPLGAKITETANIQDDDLSLEVRIEKLRDGLEGGSISALFTVTLYDVTDPTNPVAFNNKGGDITVTYAFSGKADGASVGEGPVGVAGTNDFNNTTTTVTIASGESTGTITVPIFDDIALEGPEDIIVTLTTVGSGISLAADMDNRKATANIDDNEILLHTIITKTTEGAENNGGSTTPVEFEVTLVEYSDISRKFTNLGSDIIVTVNLSGSATGGTVAGTDDYNNTTTTVTIPRNSNKGTLSLPVFEDTIMEGPESIRAQLIRATNGVGVGAPENSIKTVNIQDDDVPLEVRIEKVRDGNEAGSVAATYQVTLYNVTDPDNPVAFQNQGADINITYDFGGNASGAAVAEAAPATTGTNDFNNTTTTVTIANGQSSGLITVPVFDDNALEGPEDIIVTILTVDSGVAVAADAANASARADIIDDDQFLDVIITASTNGAEDGTSGTTTPVTFTVTLVEDGTSTPFANGGGDITVMVNLTGTATGAAAAEPATPGNVGDNDYDNSITTVTIANGASTGTLSLPVFEDTAGEGSESVIATLASASTGIGLGDATDITRTANIADDDTTLEVRIAKTTDGAENGTGSTTSATFTVTLYDVTNTSNPTIIDNPGGDMTVTYSFGGNAMGAALAEPASPGNVGNNDYDNSTTTVTIASGQRTGTITVPVFEDTALEGPEDIIVTITAVDVGAGVAADPANATATAIIADDDLALDVIITASTDGAEDGTSGTTTPVTFTVTLVEDGTETPFANGGGDITVNMNLTGTANGGTVAGTDDYDNSTTTVTIANGASTGTLTLPVFEDTAVEGPESVIATLASANNGVGLGDASLIASTANIADDDLNLEIRITDESFGDENGPKPVKITVTLWDVDNDQEYVNPGGPITVNYSFPTGTGYATGAPTGDPTSTVGDADYDNSKTSITIPTSSSTAEIVVDVFEDDAEEGPEQLRVVVDDASAGIAVSPTQDGISSNIADEDTKLKVQIFDNTEGDEEIDTSTNLPIPITYSVRIVNEDGSPYTGPKNWGPINFEFGFLNSVAKGTSAPEPANPGNVGNNDYDSATPPQGFVAGATTATISIPVWDDTAEEGSESVEIQLTTVDAFLTILQPVAGKQLSKIKDNDIFIEAKLSETVTNGNEAGEIPSTFNVKLSKRSDGSVYTNQSGGPITVTYTLTDNGATGAATANPNRTIGDTDYKNDVLTVDIPVGMSEVEISIPTFDDDAKEGPESFNLTIVSITDGVTIPTGTETRSATIIDNDIDLELRLTASTSGAEAGPVASTFEVTLWDTVDDVAFVNPGAALAFDIAYSGNASGATAAANGGANDYDNSKTTFNIPNGASKGTISVPTFDDNDEEGPESLTVTLVSGTAGVGISTDPMYVRQSTTITDDDLTLELIFDTSASVTGNEEGTVAATAKVVLVKQGTTTPFVNNGLPIEVTYSFEPDNGAAGIAVGGSDYDNSGNKITIATGDSEATITVPILDDAVKNEADETFTLTLGTPSVAGLSLGTTNNQATLTIKDNDAEAIDEPDLVPNPYVVNPTITDPTDPDKNKIKGTATIGTKVKVTVNGTDYEVMTTVDPNDPTKGVFQVDIDTTLPEGTYDVAVETRRETPDGRIVIKNPTNGPKVFDDALVIDLTSPDENDFDITRNTDTDGDGVDDTIVDKDSTPSFTGKVGPIDGSGNSENDGATVTITIKDGNGNAATDTSGNPIDPVTATINPDGTYTTPNLPTDLPDGTYTIDGTITDPSGNVSPAKTIPDVLVIDTIKPSKDDLTINFNEDTDDDGVDDIIVDNDTTPSLSGEVGPIDPNGNSDNGGGTVTITIKDGNGNPAIDTSGNPVDPIAATINPDGTWEIPGLPVELDEGTYSLDAIVTDLAGNDSDTAEFPDALVIDTTPPTKDDLTIDLNSDTDGDGVDDTLKTNDKTPSLTGEVGPRDGSGNSQNAGGTVTLTIKDSDGNPINTDTNGKPIGPITATINPDGTWEVPDLPVELGDGTYTLGAVITDPAGNSSLPIELTDVLVIDTTPPTEDDLEIDYNADTDDDGDPDTIVVNDKNPGLSGKVGPIDDNGLSDNAGGTVDIKIKDSDGNPVTDTNGNPLGTITATINPDGTWEIPNLPVDLEEGTYSIDATITDPAGNVSDPIELPDALVIDTTPPTEDDLHMDYTVDTDDDGDNDKIESLELNPSISGMVDPINPDGTSTGTVSVVIKDKDGNPVFTDPVTTTINPDGTWEIPSFPDDLNPGEYDLVVTITDQAGNATDPAIELPKAVIIVEFELIPNDGLSPNGDGMNDVWFIKGIERYKKNNVGVFNRWGTEIWGMEGYNNEDKVFEGMPNKGAGEKGKKIAVGTYFYSIDLGNGSKPMTGYFVIYY